MYRLYYFYILYCMIWYNFPSSQRSLAIWIPGDATQCSTKSNSTCWLAGKHLWTFRRTRAASHRKEIAHCQSIFEVKHSSQAKTEWILPIWSWAWTWIKYEVWLWIVWIWFHEFLWTSRSSCFCFEQDPRDAERQAALASIRALSGHCTSITSTCWRCIPYWKWGFSIAMLVYWRVYCWWFRNPVFTSWGWYLKSPLFTGFFYIERGAGFLWISCVNSNCLKFENASHWHRSVHHIHPWKFDNRWVLERLSEDSGPNRPSASLRWGEVKWPVRLFIKWWPDVFSACIFVGNSVA